MGAKNLNKKVEKAYHNITGSIAFYPTMMSFGFFLFALIIMSIEYTDLFMEIKDHISIVLVSGVDNARLILNTLIGGIFSLTVFSFSMVMIVLNRATATLSPRVIPGLITQKSHQFVLGFYLGTIIYSLMLTINLNSPEIEAAVPKLGILISLCFGISCLGLFVYFIHSISKTIQVDNILNKLFNDTTRELLKLNPDNREESAEGAQLPDMPDTKDWHTIKSHQSGYFKMIEASSLGEILREHDLIIKVEVPHGFFVVEGYPFIKVNKPIEDEELEEEILSKFIFFVEEYVKDHYSYGFKQISEIAVKALSPGINDPGTAVKAVDLLTILFKYRIENECLEFDRDDEGEARIFYEGISLDELLFRTITPIRGYGKADVQVVINLLESIKNLLYSRTTIQQQNILVEHARGIVGNADQALFTEGDTRRINDMICRINDLLDDGEELELLETER